MRQEAPRKLLRLSAKRGKERRISGSVPFFSAFPDYSGMYEGINCSRQSVHFSLGSQVVFQVFLLRGPFFLNIKLPSLPLWAVEMRVQVTPKWAGGGKRTRPEGHNRMRNVRSSFRCIGQNRTRSSQHVTGVAFGGGSKPNAQGDLFPQQP